MKFDLNFVILEHKKYQQIFKIKLPDFTDIVYSNSLEDEYGRVIIESENSCILELNTEIQSYSKQFVRCILYHEFTHQADAITCSYEKNSILYKRYLKCYSEPHASEIEFRTLLNNFYKPKIKLNLNTKVFFKEGLVPIITYLNDRIFSINIKPGYLDSLCNVEDFKKYIQKIITIFYYIGYTSIICEPESEKYFEVVMTLINEEKIKLFITKCKTLYHQGKYSDLTLLFEEMYYEVATNAIRRQLVSSSFTLSNSDINQIDFYNYSEKSKEFIVYNQNNPIAFSDKKNKDVKIELLNNQKVWGY